MLGQILSLGLHPQVVHIIAGYSLWMNEFSVTIVTILLFFFNRPTDCGTSTHHLSDPHPAVCHCASVPPQVSKIQSDTT